MICEKLCAPVYEKEEMFIVLCAPKQLVSA